MVSPEWKKYWKLLGQEKRLRRQVKTAQRTMEKADREAKRIGFITPTSTRTFQRLLNLSEKHVAEMRQLWRVRAKLPTRAK